MRSIRPNIIVLYAVYPSYSKNSLFGVRSIRPTITLLSCPALTILQSIFLKLNLRTSNLTLEKLVHYQRLSQDLQILIFLTPEDGEGGELCDRNKESNNKCLQLYFRS